MRVSCIGYFMSCPPIAVFPAVSAKFLSVDDDGRDMVVVVMFSWLTKAVTVIVYAVVGPGGANTRRRARAVSVIFFVISGCCGFCEPVINLYNLLFGPLQG